MQIQKRHTSRATFAILAVAVTIMLGTFVNLLAAYMRPLWPVIRRTCHFAVNRPATLLSTVYVTLPLPFCRAVALTGIALSGAPFPIAHAFRASLRYVAK
jgi:hypothetical protein